MGYWPLRTFYQSVHASRLGENERGGTHERSAGSRGVGEQLIEKSVEDDAFRQRLIEDPKGAVEEELGRRLPEEVRVVTVEESADTIYLVLPSTSMAGGEGGALSDQELESVAGASPGDGYTGPSFILVRWVTGVVRRSLMSDALIGVG